MRSSRLAVLSLVMLAAACAPSPARAEEAPPALVVSAESFVPRDSSAPITIVAADSLELSGITLALTVSKDSDMVRAKFRITHKTITQQDNGNGSPQELVTVVGAPVMPRYDREKGGYDESDPNRQWWQYTPSGRIELGTVNKAAADQLEIGKEYYVDFSPAD